MRHQNDPNEEFGSKTESQPAGFDHSCATIADKLNQAGTPLQDRMKIMTYASLADNHAKGLSAAESAEMLGICERHQRKLAQEGKELYESLLAQIETFRIRELADLLFHHFKLREEITAQEIRKRSMFKIELEDAAAVLSYYESEGAVHNGRICGALRASMATSILGRYYNRAVWMRQIFTGAETTFPLRLSYYANNRSANQLRKFFEVSEGKSCLPGLIEARSDSAEERLEQGQDGLENTGIALMISPHNGSDSDSQLEEAMSQFWSPHTFVSVGDFYVDGIGRRGFEEEDLPAIIEEIEAKIGSSAHKECPLNKNGKPKKGYERYDIVLAVAKK